jgi:CheY-like chemotaxis protein
LTPADPLREWIDEIGKAGENAAGLTRQLLAFSRKQILMPQTVDLNLLIAESGDMLQRLVGEDIAVVLHLAPDLGRIWADPGQLHQVLLNLVVNARDAMPDGGRLTIATANLGGGEIVMTVSDSGIGMDKAIQDRIFDPFFTTKGEGEGTGLGLASVYGIVKQCGGSISVASEPAHGATFTICLPRTEASTGQQESSSPDTSSLRGTEIVLVVDDQEPLRKLVARTLRGRGYLVLEAESAIAALAITEQSSGPIRLLITDVVMPHMNGKELSASFEQLHPQCKVLYMSGYGTEVIAKRGVTIPRSHYIAKPFTSDALAVKVREILGCQRAED